MTRSATAKQLAGPFCLFCAFTLAGTSVVSARYLSQKAGIFTITAVSLFFTLLLLLPLCRKKLIQTMAAMSRIDFFYLFLQALFGMFLFRMFLISGLMHTSAGEAGVLTGATPAITAILAAAVLKETMGIKKLAGILCTVGGVLLIQGFLMTESHFSIGHFWGNMLVLCAAACESFFNILSRFFVRKSGTPGQASNHSPESKAPPAMHPAVQTSIVSAIAMILCLIPSAWEKPLERLAHIGSGGWFALIWYGVFVTALAFIFWYAGINRCNAITAAAFSGMMPFTSLVLSVLLLGEQAGLNQWAGGLLVISGIILIGSSASSEEAGGKAIEASGDTIEASGDTIEASGEAIETSGNVTESPSHSKTDGCM